MIYVLDHGFVRLVDHMGSDLSVVRAARQSYDEAWRAGEDEGSDQRLIRYLWRNKHTSPFEAVTFTFEVKAPIFVFRQWHRHRTWSFNELSGRYKELPEEFYVPDPKTIGTQSIINKQGRNVSDEALARVRKSELFMYESSCNGTFSKYHLLLERGWPRELARCVLPLSTYSHMFATVNLLNLFRFLTLRIDKHAQFEIQEYARAITNLIEPIVPVCLRTWEENGV